MSTGQNDTVGCRPGTELLTRELHFERKVSIPHIAEPLELNLSYLRELSILHEFPELTQG